MRAVLLVQLRRALQRVGLLPELFADGRRAGRQRAGRRRAIEIAFAGDGAFAADVERLERVQLARIRDADAHAELLLHARIRDRRLHAAELEGQARVSLKFGNMLTPRRSWSGNVSGAPARTAPFAGGIGRAIRRHQRRTRAVVGLGAIDVRLHHAWQVICPLLIAF